MSGYEIKHERIALQGAESIHIRSLLDRQQFSDPNGTALALGISSATWPLFGLLWPSGFHLAHAMLRRPVRAGERILELGCGLALASLVSHRRGADVTASDCHPLAAAFLLENLALNHLPALPFQQGNWSELLNSGLRGPFDLIIGSDVLYERDEAGVLAAFIEHHASDASEVIIIDPNRGNRGHFHRHMLALGYAHLETMIVQGAVPGPAYRGRLLHFRRTQRLPYKLPQ